MFKHGLPEEIVTDTLMPCIDGKPCFARTHSDDLWVMIIQKAYAKILGSYERIESATEAEVLNDLTGAPSFVLNTIDDLESIL